MSNGIRAMGNEMLRWNVTEVKSQGKCLIVIILCEN